jgi:hypothetical protein
VKSPLLLASLLLMTDATAATDAVPSWTEGPAKQSILGFVERTIRAGSADFVSVAERIAVFHNDGTLWSEQPAYFQAFFVLDRIKAAAARLRSRS